MPVPFAAPWPIGHRMPAPGKATTITIPEELDARAAGDFSAAGFVEVRA